MIGMIGLSGGGAGKNDSLPPLVEVEEKNDPGGTISISG